MSCTIKLWIGFEWLCCLTSWDYDLISAINQGCCCWWLRHHSAAMENTSLPSDVSNNVTTSSSEYDNLFYLFYTRDFALKVIYTVIGSVVILGNLIFVFVFVFFIKIADKVLQDSIIIPIKNFCFQCMLSAHDGSTHIHRLMFGRQFGNPTQNCSLSTF